MKTLRTLALVGAALIGTTAPAAAQSGKRDLLNIIEDVGCKVTASEDGKNSKVHFADYARSGHTYHLRICLSPDNSRVWVSLPLCKVDSSMAGANADRLFRLLEKNNDVGPAHFKVTGGMLYLSGAIENREVANYRVRDLIENLIDGLEQTRSDWDVDWSRGVVSRGR